MSVRSPKEGCPVKLLTASLTLFCLAVVVVPASAQQLYDNGPINGTTDAWTINFGYIVSDSFSCCKGGPGGGGPAGSGTINGFEFGVWEYPGDTLSSVDWSITTGENSGNVLGSGTASEGNLTDQFISTNQYGYDIDKITVTGLNVPGLAYGSTYWLNLQNASVPSGDPVYWDENSGVGCGGNGASGSCPSSASESAVGTIPSEAFTIDGTYGGNGSTPEPGSILLFGSGILGVAGALRRKLKF
jgi:PEP-CTERM motif